VTGDSFPFFPQDLTKYSGSECSNYYDEMYQKACSVEVRRHLRELHVRKRKTNRWAFYKTETSTLSSWFRRWKKKCSEMIDLSSPHYRRKAQLYGAIGGMFLRTYWYQNSKLVPPQECFSPSQRLKTNHPHDVTGKIALWVPVSQFRDVSLDWVQRERPELLESDTLRKGFTPKVIVVFRLDFWEHAPTIKVDWNRRKKKLLFNVRHLRENNALVRGIEGRYRKYGNNHCVKSFWIFNENHEYWPVAVVHYQLLTGLSFVCWPEKLPKLIANTTLQRRRNKDIQLPLEMTGEPQIHPFEKTNVIWRVAPEVPWADLER